VIPAWRLLDGRELTIFRVTLAFLSGRLAEQSAINWALRLKPAQHAERTAVEHLLFYGSKGDLEEPWATAWHLIEESWSVSPVEEGPSLAVYEIQKRLKAGDRSGAIISKIVDLVAPRLKVGPFESWQWRVSEKTRRPKSVDQLVSARLTSGELIHPDKLGLAQVTDLSFLKALGCSLESAIDRGLEIARRLGWDGTHRLWPLGDLGRVQYLDADTGAVRERDPDVYHRGIAPSTKLLFAVVSRISELDSNDALPFLKRWRVAASPVHIRLWAAAAQNPRLVSPDEVAAFINGLDDRCFWNLHAFPEIAELRALRFSDLNVESQRVVVRRVRKGPPRGWLKPGRAATKEALLYWTVRELRRIEVAGGVLPSRERKWLNANIGRFSQLSSMSIDEGYSELVELHAGRSDVDAQYYNLSGIARLRGLETALSNHESDWYDRPGERANRWLRQPNNIQSVLNDLTNAPGGGDDFPQVWNRIGWMHLPTNDTAISASERDLQGEADRVLQLIDQLLPSTLAAAIEGLSAWLDQWRQQVVASPSGPSVWFRMWPLAVEATNAKPETGDETDLNVAVNPGDGDGGPMDLDVLNTSAGKLVGVFLAACPSLRDAPAPFADDGDLRQMREMVINAPGRSGHIARHRMIESLTYFLNADREWAQRNLVSPLLTDQTETLALWRAVARGPRGRAILRIIGNAMSEKANDRRLGRETQRSLVFSLIIECLYAFKESRDPAVRYERIQQMLRSLDDEVRAFAANSLQQFIRELSAADGSAAAQRAADLFRSTAAPFLQQVWPQERSLVTPGVSSAFADLPAASGEAFADAVQAIERFLVPFECWSMFQYGFERDSDGTKKIAAIDNPIKAAALLKLLNLTIGSSEGSVIPYDLTEALDQIRSVAPPLTNDPIYRRLSTAARR
jgi:hypothetical protein